MEKKTVVALGDSITWGYPYGPDVSWVEELRRCTGWQVINAGICGDTLLDMAARLERDVLRYQPRLVLVMGGTNDVYQGFSQPQMQRAFLQIMEKLREAGCQVWLGLPLPVADYTEGSLKAWRQWLRSYAGEHNLLLVDFHQDFITEQGQIKEELLLDGCHPSREGYAVMGRRIKDIIGSKGRN